MCQGKNKFEPQKVYFISQNPQHLYDVIYPRRNSKLFIRAAFVCLNVIFGCKKQQYDGSR